MIDFYELSLLWYNHHHSKNIEYFCHVRKFPYTNLKSMCCNVLFYGNGKSEINSSNFTKYNLY